MDRFVWFVLLVVFSHLVTEFTRVTGYTRGTRHDSVMVNDSLIQPIRVQNQIQYPGQEYGHYAQPSPPYYSGNSHYNNYDNNPERNGNNYSNSNTNNANNNNNNLFSNFFSGLFNQNSNTNSNNNNNGQEYPQANSNIDTQQQQPQANVRTFGIVQPIIDSIFEIPISTLRAVNNLVGRLTFSYRQQQQQQPQQQQQQGFSNHLLPHQQYSPSYPSSASASASASASPSYYGMQKSATIQPKTEFEMLKRIRQIAHTNGNSNSNSNNDPQQQQLGPIRASL